MEGILLQVVKIVTANTLTVAAKSGQTVNGGASLAFTAAFSSGTFQSNGTDWFSASDATTLNGISSDAGTTPDTIPVRDSNGRLPGHTVFRGALVFNTVGASAANPVPWTAEDYDTDTIHDNSTNNDRLTVPAGVTRVKVSAQLFIGTLGAAQQVQIKKNASVIYVGAGRTLITIGGGGTSSGIHGAETSTITVVAGDFFTVESVNTVATADSAGDGSWFAMEIIE
jgi:hypothetical protein